LKLRVESSSRVLKETSVMLPFVSSSWGRDVMEAPPSDGVSLLAGVECPDSTFVSSSLAAIAGGFFSAGAGFSPPIDGVIPFKISCYLRAAISACSFSMSICISLGDRITFLEALFLIFLARWAKSSV